MNVITVGTVTITEGAVTFTGWGNITRDHEHIIKDWAIERLVQYPDTVASKKLVNKAVFPIHVPTI